MKNNKILTIVFLMVFTLFTNNCVYGSYADYTDEDAEKDTQKMIQEHSENFDNTKSDNCFLKELSVKGGTLSPNFDRQVINYDLKIKGKTEEIDITASAEDIEAKINGSGKIKIKDISECKIEVIAASGTTRTYFIRIIREEDNDSDVTVENENETVDKSNLNEIELEDNIISNSNYLTEDSSQSDKNDEKNNSKNEYKYIIGTIFGIFLLIGLVIILKSKNKSKH